jgi:hypothetical protein
LHLLYVGLEPCQLSIRSKNRQTYKSRPFDEIEAEFNDNIIFIAKDL